MEYDVFSRRNFGFFIKVQTVSFCRLIVLRFSCLNFSYLAQFIPLQYVF